MNGIEEPGSCLANSPLLTVKLFTIFVSLSLEIIFHSTTEIENQQPLSLLDKAKITAQ